MPSQLGRSRLYIRKQISAGSIAAHPCKNRKDGAPSLEMVHSEIVKLGHPWAFFLTW